LLRVYVAGDRNIMTSPDERSTVFDLWRTTFWSLKNDEIEPAPNTICTGVDFALVAGKSEELKVLDSGDYEILKNLENMAILRVSRDLFVEIEMKWYTPEL
jgi:hypothetical protein